MVRHRWEQRTDMAAGPAPRLRFRFRLGRGAIMCLLFIAVIWIAASLLFHPPEGAGQQLDAVAMDPSAETTTASAPPTSDARGNAPGSTRAAPEPGASAAAQGKSNGSAAADPATVLVHVAGAVKKPGVYHFPSGARAQDAVRSAGGLASGAAPAAVNLAAPLVDGQQLYLPTTDELPAAADRAAPPQAAAPGAGTAGEAGAPEGQINVNTADGTDLQELPGIGPALSARIIEFRAANGPFASMEELDAVSGIGPAMMQRLEPLLQFN
ncbi:helix-hairpin-helix domain-containing protein [Arthrobacter rhombi]|uniref:helix-hairpin-helix domain-containing protein n=1 Tax=Arthrobacter rhombi TaxID=71253 RepID=UPI003FD5DD83